MDAFIRNNQALILSTLYLAFSLLVLGYAMGYSVLKVETADLVIAKGHLSAETINLRKKAAELTVKNKKVVAAIDSMPAFLEHINSLAQLHKVIIRELVPDTQDKLKYRIEIWVDYPTFLRFTASMENLNVSISDLEIRPYNLAKTPPIHVVKFYITPKNNAAPLKSERLDNLLVAVAEQGKRNPFIRKVSLPGQQGPLFIDLTWVHKLSMITREGDKLVALIDNHDYALGEMFKSVEGPIALQEITKKRIIFAKKTEQGTQNYVMKFRKKKGGSNRGKRTKRSRRQRRSR